MLNFWGIRSSILSSSTPRLRTCRLMMTILVRKLGRAAAAADPEVEQRHRLCQKASEGFKLMMRRLDGVYGPRMAGAGLLSPPDDFKDRLEHWRDHCGLPRDLHERMQRLRMWRNASEHGDAQRWRREGPRDEAELEEMLRGVDLLAERLLV